METHLPLPTTITLALDGQARIPLRNIPSTGYLWELTVDGSAISAELYSGPTHQEEYPQEEGHMVIGGESVLWLVVAARQAGSATLCLRQAQPWLSIDPNEVLHTITVQVGSEQQVS